MPDVKVAVVSAFRGLASSAGIGGRLRRDERPFSWCSRTTGDRWCGWTAPDANGPLTRGDDTAVTGRPGRARISVGRACNIPGKVRIPGDPQCGGLGIGAG